MDTNGNLNILIIDDEPDTARLLGMLLKHKVSASSDTALDCESARKKLAESSFDLITLDFQLPDCDGLSFLRELLDMKECPPVVMVTGHGDENTAVEAFKQGASGYVVKDARLNVMLVEEVKAALMKRELRKAELQLIDKDKMLMHLYESAAEGIMVGGPDGRFEYANRAMAEKLGYDSPEELIGTPIADRYADPKEREELLAILLEKGTVSDYRIHGRRKDGSTYYSEINAVLFRDEDGNIIRTTSYTSYKTEKEEAAKALESSEEKYRQMFENIRSGVVIYEPLDDGEDFVIVDCNKAADMVIDKTKSIGKSVLKLFPDIKETPLFGVFQKVWRSGELMRFPPMHPFMNDYEWVEGYAYKLPTGEVVAFFDDVTEQTMLYKALRESESRLREIYDFAAEGIAVTDAEGIHQYVNPRMAEMFGFDGAEDMIGTYVADRYVNLEDRKVLLELLRDEGSVRGYELHLKRKDGKKIWGLGNMTLILDENKNPLKKIVFLEDITEKKVIQDRLAKNEEMLYRLYNSAVEGIVIADAEGVFIYVNPRMAEMIGFESADELIGTSAVKRYADLEDRAKVLGALREKGSLQGYEMELKCKDGSKIWVLGNMSLLFDENGNPTRPIAFFTDITGKKKAEEELAKNKRKLRSIYESSIEGIVITNADGIYDFVNTKAAQIFGFEKAEDMIGTNWSEWYRYPEEREKIIETIRGEGSIKDYEAEFKRKDGSCFWARISGAVERDGAGNLKSTTGFIVDITDEKRAEEDLKKSEESLRELYESAFEGIAVANAEGVFEFVNQRFAEMFGYDAADEMIGVSSEAVYINAERRDELVNALIVDGYVRGFEIEFRRKDGGKFWGMVNIVMHKDENGKPLRNAGFVVDITEKKKVEEELRRANRELEAFAHTVSHNLKGPLSSVGMAAELLRSELGESASEEALELLENIDSNTSKGYDRIKDLLWLAESGQKPVEVRNIKIHALIDEIIEEVSEEGISVLVDEDLGELVADERQIQQVFSNIISNAVQHNTNTKPEIRIKYEGLSNDGAHIFKVSDNGPGINEDELEKIFTPFYKGASTGGTGLGLSIARQVAAVYDGGIRAYNNNGATFEVTLKDYHSEQ